MKPGVGTVFDSFDHRKGLMICARILFIGVLIFHGRPKKYPTAFRFHGL
jgi:hypothetical protein